MTGYDELAADLGIDLSNPIDALARDLVFADHRLLDRLVERRRQANLSEADVARLMGCTEDEVKEFETFTADPPLSVIRRYALAVGAKYTHSVTDPSASEPVAPAPAQYFVAFNCNYPVGRRAARSPWVDAMTDNMFAKSPYVLAEVTTPLGDIARAASSLIFMDVSWLTRYTAFRWARGEHLHGIDVEIATEPESLTMVKSNSRFVRAEAGNAR